VGDRHLPVAHADRRRRFDRLQRFGRDQQPALAKAVAAREALAVGDGVQLVLLHVDQAEIFHTAPEGAAEAGPYRDLLRRQLRETPLDEPPFGLLTSERQRALEGGARL